MKGFILSAGKGTRLLPITQKIPKPLVKIGRKNQADFAIQTLKNNSISDIGINAHHIMDKVVDYSIKNNLHVFKEPELLGTGGYLKNLGAFFDTDMLTINCDCIITENKSNLKPLITKHKEFDNTVTLLLMKKEKGSKATGISVKNNKICDIGNGDYFFTGVQIISPDVLEYIEGPSILPVFRQLMNQGKLGYSIFNGDWFDCGTLYGLYKAHVYLYGKQKLVHHSATIGKGSQIIDSVIYPDVVIGDHCEIISSIIYENTEIPSGAKINGAICHGTERKIY